MVTIASGEGVNLSNHKALFMSFFSAHFFCSIKLLLSLQVKVKTLEWFGLEVEEIHALGEKK